jgi:UDP-glucose 4-epimerase
MVWGPTNKSRWSYACSKAIDEFLAIAYWKERKVPTVIARLFNTVGPRQIGQYGMVIPNFVTQALTGADITVFGDGSQSRCFTHVNDAVNALVGIAAHPEANGEVYNVGGTHEVTILELAERIKQMTGSHSPIVFIPYSTAYEAGFEDMVRRVPDITKVNKLIGYEPTVSLQAGLESIIEDQRARLRKRGVLVRV